MVILLAPTQCTIVHINFLNIIVLRLINDFQEISSFYTDTAKPMYILQIYVDHSRLQYCLKMFTY